MAENTTKITSTKITSTKISTVGDLRKVLDLSGIVSAALQAAKAAKAKG